MFKFIIVDDECIVCDQLSKILDYEMYGLKLLGTFSNSEKALDYIKNNQLDMILCDIKMPRVSGIDIAEYCNKHKKNVKVVFITAYRNFEHAVAAVKCGVEDYLLKPISYPAFLECIVNISDSLKKQYFDEIEMDKKYFIDGSKSSVLCTSIDNYKSGLLSSYGLQEQLYLNAIKIDVKSVRNLMVSIEIKRFIEYFSSVWNYGTDRLYNAVRQVIPFETANVYIYINYISFNKVELLLIAKDSEKGVNFQNEAKDIEAFLYMELGDFLNLQIDVAVGSEKTGIENNLNLSDKDGIRDEVSILFGYILNKQFKEAYDYISLLGDSLQYLRGFLMDFTGMAAELYENRVDYERECSIINTAETEALKELLVKLVKKCEARFYKKDEDETLINRVYDYVEQNYHENISLEQIARYLFLSPNYFSYLFKKITGRKFIDYLIEFRIEKAKSIISENPKIKLEVLCDMIGYKSLPYFYKTFQKKTGISISQYKKSLEGIGKEE